MDEDAEKPLVQLDTRSLLYRALRNWYLFPLCLLLGIGAAYLYLRYTHPIYLVETDILNRATAEEQISSSLFGEIATTAISQQNLVQDEIQILRSRNLLEQIVTELGLEVRYYSQGRLQDFDLYPYLRRSPVLVEPVWPFDESAAGKEFLVSMHDGNEYTVEVDDRIYREQFGQLLSTHLGNMVINRNPEAKEDLQSVQFNIKNPSARAEEYGSHLTVERAARESNAINIQLTETVPQRGIDFLQQMFYFYDESIVNEKVQIAEKTISFLDQRLEYLGEELDLSAAASEDYIVNNDLIEGIENKLAFQVEQLREYDQQLALNALQLDRLDSLRQLLNNEQAMDRLAFFEYSPYGVTINGTDYSSLISQYANLLAEQQELELGATGEHPLLGPIQEKINGLRQYLNQELNSARQDLARNESLLRNSSDSLFRMMRSIPRYQREVEGMDRVLDIQKELYVELLKKKEENTLSRASALSELRMLKNPSLREKVSPNETRVYALLSIIGLLLPAGFITLRELLDKTIKTPEQIKKKTSAPLLGTIAAHDENEVIVVGPHSRSAIVEMFRMLRTNLTYIGAKGAIPQTILVTSTVSGEGKTFITINLGLSLAISNKRVCLVNLDLRKPKLGKYLGVDESYGGLSSHLIGETSYDDLIQDWDGNDHLHFITSGPVPPNPGELLLNPRLDELFAKLQNDFDYILIDAPPVGLVSDALSLGRVAEATLFVIRFNYSTSSSLELISDLKNTAKVPQPVVVFNGVKASRGYGYGGDYGYGYGYGYYDEVERGSLWQRLTGK